MIQNTIKFINKNITYITIFVCLIALWMIYKENYKNANKEHLVNDIKSDSFSEIVKKKKRMNFRCNINGVNYYLAQLPLSECEKKLNIDCYNSTMVLIPEDVIKSKLNSYYETVKTNKDICNSSFKIKCLNKLMRPTEEEINDCSKEVKSCDFERFFIHDFEVKEVTNTEDSVRKYLFKGTSTPDIENSITPSMMNQHLAYDKAIPVLCADSYAYDYKKSIKEYAEVIVSEKVSENTGIVGANVPIKIKLMFNTRSVLVSKNQKTNLPVYTPWPPSNPKKSYTYVGVCKDSANLMTCKNGNMEYMRLCLIYPDEVNSESNTILEFEPILIN